MSSADSATVTLRMATTVNTNLPMLARWSGCQPSSTTIEAIMEPRGYTLTYRSTFSGFTGPRTCTAEIEQGALAVIMTNPTVRFTTATSDGHCIEYTANSDVYARVCFLPLGTRVAVESQYTSWRCGTAQTSALEFDAPSSDTTPPYSATFSGLLGHAYSCTPILN
jgi:hypothetical protein